jgi:DNA (cytosine-5)-methyltransferase 1
VTILLSVSETAKKLNVSPDTIRRWDKHSLIKSQRSPSNHRLFDFDEVERLHRKQGNRSLDERHYSILSSKPTNFTAIDLFAGGGGTALGLEHAGFKHVLLNEFDKDAASTLRANRPGWNVVEGDVAAIDFTPFQGNVDLVEGGFPCQAFSYAGRKGGFEDTRGTLFYEFARTVNEVRPKIAVGENVKGLLTHDHGRTLKTMVRILQGMGYDVAHRVMRAQYHDVPQKRERLIIVAVRKDLGLPILFPKEKDYIVSLWDAIGDRPQSDGQTYSPWKHEVLSQIPAGGYWRDLPEETQRAYLMGSFHLGGGKTGMARRLSWDEPSLTLTCNPAQKQTERCHPEETRPLNVREYARIQTFPDSWQFSGSVSAQYRQIGNAVPVNLGYHLGRAVIAMLDGDGREAFHEAEALPEEG